MNPPTAPLTFVAVGAGPSNLSLAALSKPHPDIGFQVLERNPAISWHPGMMVRAARLQVAPVKDLVTLVDPGSPFSFNAFLKAKNRLHRALVAHRSGVSRQEYEQYYDWVAGQIEEIALGEEVREIDFRSGEFRIRTANGASHQARNVVVGVGRAPRVPEYAKPLLGDGVFHSSRYADRRAALAGGDVLVVGGGQSAAEIVLDLLSSPAPPRSLTWATGRSGLVPLDDSPFANEWYNPAYTGHFFALDADRRAQLLGSQVYSSDGVTEDLLQQIYTRLYEIDYIEPNAPRHRVLPGHRLLGLKPTAGGYRAVLSCPESGTTTDEFRDHVILATGYESSLPEFLGPLTDRLDIGREGPGVQLDYAIRWDGPADRRIFVQNAARSTHGLADSNLALVSWRSAVILNAMCGDTRYELPVPDLAISID
ncbi:SidA/IucD/PvdA family monooxygenase [Streptomyces sp. W16]|uniref:lysine N(6)-hydroxylase/L-ornithine N(5)-oxygenase family protein n=1 Tax=Streptomyces sp. W16 TaxID=3076631 RepID=UPI00295B32B6|nr:SidA/IucD/PvdA family monooxygenase [Streptomyces sp. W16]MDV9176784.1 SidA/IucD/PvdA family monooxygenase [Streptomyces sp. W16]